MAKLPRVTGEQTFHALLRGGWEVARQEGSHAQLRHPDKPGRRVTVARHRHPMPVGTLHKVLRQAGLTVDEFKQLL